MFAAGAAGALGTPAGLPLLPAPATGATACASAPCAAGVAPINRDACAGDILALTNLPLLSESCLLSLGLAVLIISNVSLNTTGLYVFSGESGGLACTNCLIVLT